MTHKIAFLACLPASLPACLVALGLAGCNPPPASEASEAVAAANVAAPPTKQRLPAPVRAKVDQLKEIAGQGDYRGLAKLAAVQPDFRSNQAGMTPRDYWRLKASAGDDPTRQLVRLLSSSPAVVEGVAGRSYVWPALATLRPAEVTPAIEAEIDALLGAGQGASFARGAPWSGYSLAIREDGAWLWFTAGAG